jgi:hypothetical protein
LTDYVLFEARLLLPKLVDQGFVEPASVDELATSIQQCGMKVIDTVIDLLGQHRDAPPGFFLETFSPAAKRAGYRIFRCRMQHDQVGWRGAATLDDNARAEIYSKAFRTEVSADQMWLHSIFGKEDIGWVNGAWVLAMHAGDWTTSVRYASELLGTFPEFMYQDVMNVPAIYNDRSVWPGVAAIMLDREYDGLDKVREQLLSGDPRFSDMMASVTRMIPLVEGKLSYIEVLTQGSSK